MKTQKDYKSIFNSFGSSTHSKKDKLWIYQSSFRC